MLSLSAENFFQNNNKQDSDFHEIFKCKPYLRLFAVKSFRLRFKVARPPSTTMGNQLVGVAPSQIFPVEHYLTGSFESDLQYESRWVEKCSASC